MNRRTRALDIPDKVKKRVFERDKGCCILCGSPDAAPNAHYISRAQGGRGIEENVVTLCEECHSRYDNGAGGRALEPLMAAYLKARYPGWRREALLYRKNMSDL